MKRLMTVSCGMFGALAWIGCGGGERVNVGDTAVLGAQLRDYAGEWEGYAEASDWDDGTDTVRLKLDGSGAGAIQFGDAAPRSALVDPALSFPDQPAGLLIFPDPITGFSYPIYDANVETQRIRLR